jgi:hypothetical protein
MRQHPDPAQRPIRPGKRLYLIAAAAAALGVAVLALSVRGLLIGFPFDATQVVGPGETRITLDQPGDYVIAYEPRSTTHDGRLVYDSRGVVDFEYRVLSPSGTQVPLETPSSTVTYSFGEREGEVIAGFTAPEPGQYTLATRHANRSAEPEFVVTVGEAGSFVPRILGIVGGGFVLFAAGVTALVTLIVRANAKSKARNAQAPPPQWSPPPPSWGAPS